MFSTRKLLGKFATDTLWATTKSLNGNVATQVYTHKCGFASSYPLMAAKGDDIGYSLTDFMHEYGSPQHLTFDGAQAQKGPNTLFMKNIRRAEIQYHISAPRKPNENPAEGGIREIKKRMYRIMMKKHVPRRLWDYGIKWVCETGNLTVSSSRYAKGRTPLEIITGETPDITQYLDFGFYDWVTFKQNAGVGAGELGRWLGISHKTGPLMSYWVIPISGIPISVTTVQRLTNLEQRTTEWQRRCNEYTTKIEAKLTLESALLPNISSEIDQRYILDLETETPEFLEDFNRVINDTLVKHEEDADNAIPWKEERMENDPYITMEMGLPRGEDGELHRARVKRRRLDDEGQPLGHANNNPLLDSRQYEVEYLDGTTETLTANIIAENLLAQVDEEGHQQMMFEEILDHRQLNTAVPKDQGFYTNPQGIQRRIRTTKGWQVCVQWKDGSTDWIELKDFKASYPVELAEYAVVNKIEDEPAFAWWVPYTLKKRDRIISKMKTKYMQTTYKYGIKIPKNVEDAYKIDAENGNTMWTDSIIEEMQNVRVAFELCEGNPHDLVGYQEVRCRIIFAIKLGENFRRKSRYVAGGHTTDAPSSITYSSVVSRDSVRICLLLAALNGIEILCGDIQNAYLTAPNREKIWCWAGPEFGPDAGKPFIIVRALYGLKSAGAAFRAFLAEKLDDMGFRPSEADPDVWMRPSVKPDGEEYYEYLLVYVDDILALSMEPQAIMDDIGNQFKFKGNKTVPPETYLGARLEKKPLNGNNCWTMSSVDYVKAAVAEVVNKLAKENKQLVLKAVTPMTSDYAPELDGSPELNADDTQYYQELIGILRWATEIGRVDIVVEVSIMSQFQAMPREGHLKEVLHMFAFLKRKPKLTLYFDPMEPNLDISMFETNSEDFKEHYRDAKEELPWRMPKPRGRPVSTTAFMDASHAANKKTRRSHTGYLIFINRAPIFWYSKRQHTVESSSFSAEFIAMRACIEQIQSLRFKLRMFGVPIQGETKVFCDNEAVVKNSSKFESSLNKKHNSIAYHITRYAVAAKIAVIGWISGVENLADAFTKRLSAAKRDYLFGNWTY